MAIIYYYIYKIYNLLRRVINYFINSFARNWFTQLLFGMGKYLCNISKCNIKSEILKNINDYYVKI